MQLPEKKYPNMYKVKIVLNYLLKFILFHLLLLSIHLFIFFQAIFGTLFLKVRHVFQLTNVVKQKGQIEIHS
jgi:hypothetical protein